MIPLPELVECVGQRAAELSPLTNYGGCGVCAPLLQSVVSTLTDMSALPNPASLTPEIV